MKILRNCMIFCKLRENYFSNFSKNKFWNLIFKILKKLIKKFSKIKRGKVWPKLIKWKRPLPGF